MPAVPVRTGAQLQLCKPAGALLVGALFKSTDKLF